MRQKITYVISDINRALAFEWIADRLNKDRFDLKFVILNPQRSVLQDYLEARGIPVVWIRCGGKRDWAVAFLKLFLYFLKEKPSVVHCHLQQACILGLSAAKLAGVSTRIHTRHHSSLHHVYFKKGVYWDKLINRLSTRIVAISAPVEEILTKWENVPSAKLVLIPHGFLLEEFSEVDPVLLSSLREKYDLVGKFPVIGVVSRFTEWKGVQFIIPAFKSVLKKYPDAVVMLFNATGDYSDAIVSQLIGLPERSYRTITFEPAMAAAYHLFDLCVHAPIDGYSEAFGQVYIEAFAAGVPMVATPSGIGQSILSHRNNAWVVPFRDSEAIAQGIASVLSDKELSSELIVNGKDTARDFSLKTMIDKLESLYASV